MKIVLSTRRFLQPFTGGADTYCDRLGRALVRLGHQVVYLAFDVDPQLSADDIEVMEELYQDTKVWRFKLAVDKRSAQAQRGYDPAMGARMAAVLEEERPDLLIVVNFYLVTLAIVEAANSLDIPVVHVATDFLPVCRRATMMRWDGKPCVRGESIRSCTECFISHHPLGRGSAAILGAFSDETLLRLAGEVGGYSFPNPLRIFNPYWKQVRLMDERQKRLQPLRESIGLVFAPTQYTRKQFVENGFHQDQVYHLPFAVEEDHPLSQVEHQPAGRTRFLFIGRLQPYKGAHLLIEAFNRLVDPRDAMLQIYGIADGYEAYFENLLEKIKASPRVEFLGPIPPAELGRAFSEADYFVLPSTWNENSPLIVLDALQSKTPVISSDIGGVTDVVKDGVNGFLFPMGDVGALTEVLQRAIDQPELVERFRAGIRLPNIDNYAEALLWLCRERGLLPEPEALLPAGVDQR